jgi:hypothetical protein
MSRRIIRFGISRVFIEFLIFCIFVSSLLIFVLPIFIKAQNINTPEMFPDPAFRRAVEKFMNVNEGGEFTRSQAKRKKGHFVCEAKGIKTLRGIEIFSSIETLKCGFNEITSIDLSKNYSLKQLYCNQNQLKDLDLSYNNNLQLVCCNKNTLQKINLNYNSKLVILHCADNQLTELDITV